MACEARHLTSLKSADSAPKNTLNQQNTVMSKATKRKHVRREAVEEEVTPTGDQIIVKVGLFVVTTPLFECLCCFLEVTCGRGNNLHEVETCEGTKFLVSMPTKFRKSVWIKRGMTMH